METRRQALGQQHTEKVEVARSEGTIRAEAMEQALSEQGRVLSEALEAGDRINRLRTDELRAEAGRLQDVANAQTEGIGQASPSLFVGNYQHFHRATSCCRFPSVTMIQY